MMVTRTVSLALGLVGGIVAALCCGVPVPPWWLAAAGFAGLAGSVALYRRERRWERCPPLFVVLAALLCTAPLGYWRAWNKIGPPAPGTLRQLIAGAEKGDPLILNGKIAREPDIVSETRGALRLRVDRVRRQTETEWRSIGAGDVLVTLALRPGDGPGAEALFLKLMNPEAYGYRVSVDTRYRPLPPRLNPGEFDFETFLLQDGIESRLEAAVSRVQILEESRGKPLTELALAAKTRFLATYRETVRSPASRLVAGATLGYQRALQGVPYRGHEIIQMFRQAGVGHVLAVSGLHVSVVSLLLFWMLTSAGMKPRAFAPLLIFFLLLFTLITGARPSSVRAVVMNSVVIAVYAYGRGGLRSATYAGLAVSAIIVLVLTPMVLFAPSFLLSYGAVLSLILLAPPFDRWLCRLRGAQVLAAAAWFVAALLTLTFRFHLALRPAVLAAFAAALWLGVTGGARLNMRFPRLWAIGFERLPAPLRMLISAQFAIQAGMMIPLSAWYFGQFPVAGMLVNIPAIPLIGVVIQLGIMTGLVGLVPVAGPWLAIPFGAAATVACDLFFLVVWAGVELLPFEAVPRPTVGWLIGYYAALAALASSEVWLAPLRALHDRLWRAGTRRRRALLAAAAALPPAALLAWWAADAIAPRPPHVRSIVCCAARQFPIMTIVSDRNTAAVINAGDRYSGGRMLFDVLRTQRAHAVETAVLPTPQPRAGHEGLAAMAARLRVGRCFVPVVAGDSDGYLAAVADPYVTQQAMRGADWALRYRTAYEGLTNALAARGTELRALPPEGDVLAWPDLRVAALPACTATGRSASRLLTVSAAGFRWVVVTDTSEACLREAGAGDGGPCDVLVLPELGARKSYARLVDAAVAAFAPRVVIVAGDREPQGLDPAAWTAAHPGVDLLMTGRDGAVTATFEERNAMRLETFLSHRAIELHRTARDR